MCHECEIREQRIVFSPRTCLNGGEPGPEQVREAKKQKEEIENPSQDQPKGGPIQGAGGIAALVSFSRVSFYCCPLLVVCRHEKKPVCQYDQTDAEKAERNMTRMEVNVRVFFFFLHCRTSARHGRSTTGISMWLRSNFPKRKKPTTNPPKNNKTSNTHTQAKARARQISQGNLQTKWNMRNIRAPLSPSYVLVHRVVLLHVVQ